MKLRNKKTGEIRNCQIMADGLFIINSLADLEEWEDAPEEPKGKWFISNNGQIHNDEEHERFREERKQIDNYFETKEEAELAVRKLKAWKRLRDKGFSFDDWNWKTQCISYNLDYTDITEEQIEEAEKDLDLLFGGDE